MPPILLIEPKCRMQRKGEIQNQSGKVTFGRRRCVCEPPFQKEAEDFKNFPIMHFILNSILAHKHLHVWCQNSATVVCFPWSYPPSECRLVWSFEWLNVSVYCKVRPTPSSWSLDSVKEGAPSFSDSFGKMLCPPVPPRPLYSGKVAHRDEFSD